MDREKALEFLDYALDAMSNKYVEQKIRNGGTSTSIYLSSLTEFNEAAKYIRENLK
jgi:hypothetical protein